MTEMPTQILTKTPTRVDLNLKILIGVAIIAGLIIGASYALVLSSMASLVDNTTVRHQTISKNGSNLVSIDGGKDKVKKEYQGYIIQLKQKSMAEKNLELIQKVKKGIAVNLRNELNTHKAVLASEKATFKNKLSAEIRSKNQNIKEFAMAFNGLTLNITDEEAKQIKKMVEVKSVSPNYKIYANLADSVPMIGANQVWQLDTDGNPCATSGKDCLTGKGIKIGIIDTGVDYTHPDLGGSAARPMPDFLKKIGDINVPTGYNIQLSENKVFFSHYYDVNSYDFQTDMMSNLTINQEYYYNRFFSYGNMIVAMVNKKSTGEGGVIEINLNTNSERTLIPFTSSDVQFWAHRMEKSLFLDYAITAGSPVFKEYVYDFDSKDLRYMRDIMAAWGVVNNNKLYTVDGNNATHIIVDDLISGQQLEDFDTKGMRTALLDSFADEILVYRIDAGIYELINTKTGEAFQFPAEIQQQSNNSISSSNSQSAFWVSNPWLAALNDQIVVMEYRGKYGDDNIRKFYLYDRIKDKIVSFYNLPDKIDELQLYGNRICFSTVKAELYCFDYSSDENYVIPEYNGFSGKVIGGWDFVNNDNDPMDDMGHGTHVAAIAAGNGVLKGVAPGAKIIAYKVLDAGGSGWTDTIILAIERAVDPNQDNDISDHLDVINLSLGGGGSPDDPMSTAIDNAVNAGVLAAIAAGNWGPGENTISSPGTARNAITVGAIDKSSQMAYFSSQGPVLWQDSQGVNRTLVKPDLIAPGVNICAAEWDNTWADYRCLDNQHISISGTSMATPHVAGAAALLKQKNPSWTPEEIKLALRSKAESLGADLDVNIQGYGKLNVLRGVQFKGIPGIARIYTSGFISGNSFNISGVAAGRDFDHYVLSYGRGQNPSNWIEIKNSNIPVDGIFYSAFDASLLNDGRNYLRLVVYNKDGEAVEDRSLILTDTLNISEPQSNDVYLKGSKIKIIGSISGKFTSFTVEYGQGKDPANWSSQGIKLFRKGQGGKPINNSLIADWDTSLLPRPGFYSVQVKVTLPDGRVNGEYAQNIYFDENLKVGWPQKINWYFYSSASNYNTNPNTKFFTIIPRASNQTNKTGSATTVTKQVLDSMVFNYHPADNGYYYWGGYLAPVVSDINKDKFKEIIVYKGGWPPQILVYRYNGSLLWSQNIGSADLPGGNLSLPLVADLNSDNFQEIVAFHREADDWTSSKLVALKYNKKTLWSVNVPMDSRASLLAADLNRDGKKEVVMQGYNNLLVLNGMTGEIVLQVPLPPVSWSSSLESSPAVGNFDDDQDLEIVISQVSPNAGYNWETGEWVNEALLYIYNLDGSLVSGWPVVVPGSISSSPVVGDIDGDGQDNIVIGYIYASEQFPDTRYGGLYAFNCQGEILPGWPFKKGWNFWSTPSLADLNADGKLEIVASRLGYETSVLNYRGEVLPGWPQYTTWNDYYGSIIGDINGDRKLDIITTAGSGFYPSIDYHGGVEAWDLAGNKISGFPKVTESDAQAPAVINDIDNDGKLELIASSDWDFDNIKGDSKHRGSIYVWELDGVYSSNYLPWPTFMHDTERTGLYPYSTSSLGTVSGQN